METKRYPLTEEIDGVNGYVEISKGRQKFVMKDGKKVAHSAFTLAFSVLKKSFRHAWSRNTPSAQPVSVRFAPVQKK